VRVLVVVAEEEGAALLAGSLEGLPKGSGMAEMEESGGGWGGGRCRVLPFRLFDQEFWADGDLECGGEGVGFGGHADDSEEFGVLLIGEAFGSGGGGVGVNAVAAAVGDGDSDIDELFGERVECAGSDHNLLDAGPGALEEVGLVG
jgi:hypothetical protein